MTRKVESYKVSILDEAYTLVSDEGKESVFMVAQRVDALMREIAEKLKNSDSKRIAVLAAIKLANQLQSLENRIAKKDLEESHLVDYINRELASL